MINNYKVILFLCILCLFPKIGNTFEVQTPLTQGAFIYGTLNPDETVILYDHILKADKNGRFIGALPVYADKSIDFIIKKGKQIHKKTFSVTQRLWHEEIVNGLPPKKVTPDNSDQKRIQQESQLLKKARKSSEYTNFPICFNHPVTNYKRISSEFGSKRILNGIKTTGHSGTDYAAPIGTIITAPADGLVKLVHPNMFFSGKTILIDHGFGIFSSYSHLDSINVKTGQFIKRGEQIGTIGTTGRSTGPHLHFTLSWYEIRVDPEKMIQEYPCK